MATADILLQVIKAILVIWSVLTYPIYQALQKPWERKKAMTKTRSKAIKTSTDEIVYETPEKSNPIYDDILRSKVDTMDKAWSWAVNKYGNKPLLGTRDILAEEDEVQPNGKTFKKLHMGDYRWISYEDANNTAENLGRGLRDLGLSPRDKICVFADTRNEWFLTAQAVFKQAFAVVTLYTNLGEEAVEHGVNQTQVSVIVTSHDLLPKFRNILAKTPTVRTIVYFEDQVKSTDTTGFPQNVEVLPFWDVVSRGRKLESHPDVQPSPPNPTDPAIIMYTSGSTGVPKGVVLSHRNVFATLKSILLGLDLEAREDDTYIAFLPLAHVLELLCEIMMCVYGVRIGYSTANTLIDRSSMVKRGSKGDATVLKPTVMAAVPLILDRVYKSISEAVAKKGPGFQKIFKHCYDYRLEAMRNGEDTPVLNKLLFSNFQALFGGRLRVMMAGRTLHLIELCSRIPITFSTLQEAPPSPKRPTTSFASAWDAPSSRATA